MFRFFRRYFAFFASAVLAGPQFAGVLQAADGQFYLLNYEDAAVSPRAKVTGVSEKLKRLARQSVPSVDKRAMREIYVQLSDGKKHPSFTYRLDRHGNMRIFLPDSYGKLLAAEGSLPRLTGLILFGRAGKDPALERHFRNSWFVVGLSRKALGEMRPGRVPFAGYFPAAYALTSAERYPELESLLAQPLEPEDAAPRLLYEEYCELLILICARNGLLRSGVLTRILEELAQSPLRADMPELFRTFSRPVLEKRLPKMFPRGLDPAGEKAAYENWFRKELDALLNWTFLPASAGKIETRYLQAVRFEGTLKETDENRKDRPKTAVRGRLPELIRHYSRLEQSDRIAGEILNGLALLLKQAPPDLKIPIIDLRQALQDFFAAPSAEAGEKVLRMEQQFWQAAEWDLVLEKFLAEAEAQCTAPAARYYQTFRSIDSRRRPESQPLRRLAELLEKTEREVSRQ